MNSDDSDRVTDCLTTTAAIANSLSLSVLTAIFQVNRG